jgi:hypothetical protein
MSLYVCDCESDGPMPGQNEYSMVCFGVVKVDNNLDKTFYAQTKPISKLWLPDALAISGFSREEHENFPEPVIAMTDFAKWIKETCIGKPVFISDNNGYDFAFISYYFHKFYGNNPFGWSSRRIGDLFCGAERNLNFRWKKFRKTSHDHNPVNDAKGNAEALLYLFEKYGIKIPK